MKTRTFSAWLREHVGTALANPNLNFERKFRDFIENCTDYMKNNIAGMQVEILDFIKSKRAKTEQAAAVLVKIECEYNSMKISDEERIKKEKDLITLINESQKALDSFRATAPLEMETVSEEK